MSATALDLPGRPWPADERESLAEEVRTVGMVWERRRSDSSAPGPGFLSSFIQPVLFLFVLGYGMSTLVGTTAGFDFSPRRTAQRPQADTAAARCRRRADRPAATARGLTAGTDTWSWCRSPRDGPCLAGQPRGLPHPAELHTDGALPPFSRASSPQKLASPTFQVPFWYTATPD